MALLQGAGLLVATMVVFRLGLVHTGSEASGRALAFSALIAGNVALILVNRSWQRSILGTLTTRNLASWAVVVGAALVLFVAVEVPFARELFRFDPVSPDDLGVAIGAGVVALAWFEVLKLFEPTWLTRP